MDFGNLTGQLLLIAVPGMIASRLYRKLRGRPESSQWHYFGEVIVLSALCYALLGLVWQSSSNYRWVATGYGHPVDLTALPFVLGSEAARSAAQASGVHWAEATLAVALAPLAGWFMYRVESWWVQRAATRAIRNSVVTGDVNPWVILAASGVYENRWVSLIDHQFGRAYVGAITAISRDANSRGMHEIVLREAIPFLAVEKLGDDGDDDPKDGYVRVRKQPYPLIYLRRAACDITILLREIPGAETADPEVIDPLPHLADTGDAESEVTPQEKETTDGSDDQAPQAR